MKKIRNLMIYAAILLISAIILFTDFEFATVFSFLNGLLPMASVIIPIGVLMRFILKTNPWAGKIRGAVISFFTITVLGFAIAAVIPLSLIVIPPGSAITAVSPGGERLTFVDRSVLLNTNIRIYRDYVIIRRYLHKKIETDDGYNPVKDNACNIQWGSDYAEIQHPFFVHDEPIEQWRTVTVDL